MAQKTRADLTVELNNTLADLEDSEAVVEKQIGQLQFQRKQYDRAQQSNTSLKARNKILLTDRDKNAIRADWSENRIKEHQATLTGLRKNLVKYQDANADALAAIELGIEVFFPGVHYMDDTDIPVARLLLIAAGRLDQTDE